MERSERSTRWLVAMLLVVGLVAAVTACEVAGGTAPDPAAVTVAPPPIRYAALGDSYSSGEGAPPDDVSGDPCHRAPAAWPRRLDAQSALITSLDHRACSGAKTGQLLTAWSSRGLPAQIPSTPDLTVTLVTVTIGGNDVGFGDIVAKCVIWACPSPTDKDLTAALATLQTTLQTQVYPALRTAYPNARIAHVGYPRITPAPGKASRCIWLSKADQTAAAGIVDKINATIKAATTSSAASAVTYVDITGAVAGHEMCTSSPWIRGVPSSGQAHPMAAGQTAIEKAVAATLGIPLGA